MNFGVNLSFAVKRWPEPPVWAKLVRETLGLNLVQFTYDLLDPWSPEPLRRTIAAEVRQAAQDFGITIESAFSGLVGAGRSISGTKWITAKAVSGWRYRRCGRITPFGQPFIKE